MIDQQYANSGILFVNNKKTSEKQPDRTGKAVVGGVEYMISGWIKKDRNGNPFLTLSFTPKDDINKGFPAKPKSSQSQATLDDELTVGF